MKEEVIERIAGLQKVSLIDWEGKMAAVVFLSGCNWSCPFCHNYDLCRIEKRLDEEKVLSYLHDRKDWLDGVVICGGEPMLQKDVVFFAERLKGEGFKIKIDTNGSRPEILKELIDNQLVDYVAMDIKTALTEEKYIKATGVDQLNKVLESMDVLCKGRTDFEFRTTMVPEIVSGNDIIFNMEFIPKGTKYVLQQFLNENVKDESFKKVKPYGDEDLIEILDKLRQKGVVAWLRN